MAPVDIFLLLALLASVLLGLWRGLVFEVLSVLGWVAAFFAAQWFAVDAAGWLPMDGFAEPLQHAAGFAVVFVVVAFLSGFVAWLIKKLVEQMGMRPVDRVLGAGFGLLRGLVLLLALALVVGMTPLRDHSVWRSSVGAEWLTAGLRVIKGTLPQGMVRNFP